MTQPAIKISETLKPRDRIIVALDVSTVAEAQAIVDELNGRVGAFKIGLQLFISAGPEFVRKLAASGVKVFLDLKFHDIPNTVAMAAVEAAKLGVWMLNVHASGGNEMMRNTVTEVKLACNEAGIVPPLLIAVTVLTSSDGNALRETGIETAVADQVVRLARLAADAEFDGVVASAQEARAIRNAIGADFMIVTPGIRPIGATIDDQRRVTTFGKAISAGSDYVVIGRPITQSPDRSKALGELIAEIEG